MFHERLSCTMACHHSLLHLWGHQHIRKASQKGGQRLLFIWPSSPRKADRGCYKQRTCPGRGRRGLVTGRPARRGRGTPRPAAPQPAGPPLSVPRCAPAEPSAARLRARKNPPPAPRIAPCCQEPQAQIFIDQSQPSYLFKHSFAHAIVTPAIGLIKFWTLT